MSIQGTSGRIPAVAEMSAFAITGRGCVRAQNEDAVLVSEAVLTGESFRTSEISGSGWVLAVADGMGGHAGGEVASETVVRKLSRPRDWSMAGAIEALKEANRELYDAAGARPELIGMGATVAGVAFGPDGLLAFNVGDSRVYRLAGGFMQPLTKDDSLHQLMVDSGVASGERPDTKHSILQSLGGSLAFSEIDPHVHRVRLIGKGRFCICSDGLTDMLDADALEAAVLGMESCEDCARALYNCALAAGGRDNISVIVADIAPVGDAAR
jgi:serine/threonine protein phosphatase PrpC